MNEHTNRLSDDIREVAEYLPPWLVASIAKSFMIVELQDRRRQHRYFARHTSLSSDEKWLKRVQLKALKAQAVGLWIRLELFRIFIVGLVWMRVLNRQRHESLQRAMELIDQAVTSGALREATDQTTDTLDERQAKKAIADYLALIDRLRSAYGTSNIRIEAYLTAHHATAIKSGQKMAEAAVQILLLQAQARTEDHVLRQAVTIKGTIFSLVFFLKQIVVVLVGFIGGFFLAKYVHSEQVAPATEHSKFLVGCGGALLALAFSWIRLLLNHMRTARAQRKVMLSFLDERLESLRADYNVEIQMWPDIRGAFKMLTGSEVSANDEAAHRSRMDDLTQKITSTTARIRKLTEKPTFMQRFRNIVDAASQGGLSDMLDVA